MVMTHDILIELRLTETGALLFDKWTTMQPWNNSRQLFREQKPLISKLTGKDSQTILTRNQTFFWEFDPGSGWTLAACLTHASRTGITRWAKLASILSNSSGGRVSNAWVTCHMLGDNSWKRLLIPHKRTGPHGLVWKTPVVHDGPASD